MKKIKSIAELNKTAYIRNIPVILLDILLINASAFLALFLRLDFDIANIVESGYWLSALKYAPVNTVTTITIFIIMKLYVSLWEYTGPKELLRVVLAVMLSTVLETFGMFIWKLNIPRSFALLSGLVLTAFLASERLIYRLIVSAHRRKHSEVKKARTMLIGAGRAGSMLLKDLQQSEYSANAVVCIIDDDKKKHGQYLQGIKIVGGRESILESAEKYKVSEIILAIPTAPGKERSTILKLCQATKCRIKTIPALVQLTNGEFSIHEMRDIQVEDLLGRDAVKINLDDVMGYVSGKTVLVTGGGGSIGSELCRQIATYKPKKLVILDIYENNAYAIQQELLHDFPELSLDVMIGSVRDKNRIDALFEKYRPDIVYHAAAHKHVPLMEMSPNEAIKNNVFGTLNVVEAADRYKAETFVLISTDKAVNPTNIMGASKRICEMIVQMYSHHSDTKFVAVRFGNVLGSNGSVIPLFKRQIEQGGPVTVTHKDIIRYFMTIPEAVSLVLQAGAFAEGGEIFVLDMGNPVKIDDLARDMIRLMGYEPDVDIRIEYTGLRPGEKLYEELMMAEEGLTATENNLIFIGKPLDFNETMLMRELAVLRELASVDMSAVKQKVQEIVKTYVIAA